MMKRLIAMLICALACSACLLANAEDGENALKEKYESKLAIPAVQTLCRVGSDDLNKWGTDRGQATLRGLGYHNQV